MALVDDAVAVVVALLALGCSIGVEFGNLKCQGEFLPLINTLWRSRKLMGHETVTVHMTPDCTDSGMDIGAPQDSAKPGCFSNDGGIKAYKVQCPWWNS